MFGINLLNKFYILVLLFLIFLHGIENEDVKLGELPYCGPADDNNQLLNRFVFVSTLDGRLSALNVADGGSESWSMPTGPGPMLSSSIHRLELSNNGHWVRMIPSLSGGLYKFNGENVEAVPITADHLLKSSFRYSEDLVISGGKESRTYGVDVETGRILYECSMNRCDNLTEDGGPYAGGDVVLVQRQTQTVRAVEPRTGMEKWNFSVGQHDVKLAPDPASDCHSQRSKKVSDINFKVIVPEGLVCALSKLHPDKVIWSHKFNSPVVSAWVLDQGKLQWVDLFGGTQPQLAVDEDPLPESPTLYIGMHNKQLYIQESVTMQNKLQEIAGEYRQHMITDNNVYPRIPWRPVRVTSAALGLQGRVKEPDRLLITDESSQAAASTAGLSVLYASEYVNGNGYYLYSSPDNKANVGICSHDDEQNMTISEKQEEDDGYPADSDIPVPIIIVSLWFWWKEVVVISIATAVLVNLLLQRKFMHFLHHPSHELQYFNKFRPCFEEKDSGIDLRQLSVNSSSSSEDSSYVSRYLTDFEPVHRLGKGGFGVVFEAKNKIDDCHYAIKRIPLPNRQESRERVMREVKALAKLDHQNIVRYFNAWLECPPPGWQEQQDKLWNNRISDYSYGDATSVDLTGQLTPEADTEQSLQPIFQRKVPKSFGVLLNNTQWINALNQGDVDSFEEIIKSKQYLNSKPRDINIDDSDSFIVFESSNKSGTRDDVFQPADSVITLNSSTDESSEPSRNLPRKRPNSLKIDSQSNTSSFPVNSLRMYLFIQMQLCRKESLTEWLSDNVEQRDFNEVLNIFEQIVQAVEYVHFQGLIHRDLKPSNIFFSPDGQIKVGDFGLVTAMPENSLDQWTPGCDTKQPMTDERHTAQVGTQLYMSPEQLSGRPYNYKVDIYSLGLILFELLVSFNTRMERIRTLTDLRHNKFPADFQRDRQQEYNLLRIMLSHNPEERPTTIGIRARPPLLKLQAEASLSPNNSLHFELPARRRGSSLSKSSSHSSCES